MTVLSIDHFVTARAGFQRRLATDRAAQFGRAVKSQYLDDAGMLVEVDDPSTPPLGFHLLYRDAKDAVSGRCVTIRTLLDQGTDVRITALCHLRTALRMFMASRVIEVTDLVTGEVHDNGLTFFREHPLLHTAPSEADRASPEARAIRACQDEIVILSFVGASDGDFDDDEHEQIVRHVLLRCDDPLDEDLVSQRIRAFVPDEQSFERALNRLCDGRGDAVSLMRSMRRIIDADGEVDPEEVAFASEVQNRLAVAGQL
jgi:hypothetical protein